MGAAKLLGKYPGSSSLILLVGALDDDSALVRRARLFRLPNNPVMATRCTTAPWLKRFFQK